MQAFIAGRAVRQARKKLPGTYTLAYFASTVSDGEKEFDNIADSATASTAGKAPSVTFVSLSASSLTARITVTAKRGSASVSTDGQESTARSVSQEP